MASVQDIKVKISADISDFNSKMKKLSSELQTSAKEFDGLTKAGQAVSGLGKALMPVTVAIGGVGVASTKLALDFQASMSKVQAISGASGKQLEKLTATARDLGSKTKFSAMEASEGMQYFAMAGYSVNDIMSALPSTLALATAGGAELGVTCDIVSDAMTGLGMSAKETGTFADIMASTCSKSNTSITLMGETLKYVAPVAGTLGINMKDLSVAIGLMGNAGIKGSQAGTALKNGLVNLVKPTDQMAEAMNKYGIELQKNEDGSINLMKTMQHLREKLGGLDQATQANVLSTIFGKEAMAGWASVINASEKDFNKLTNAIYNSDSATRKMTKASKFGGTTLEQMNVALGSVTDKLGDTITDTDGLAVALGTMAKAGFEGKEAGDALANGLQALTMPVKATQEAMKEWGVEVKKNEDGSIDLMATMENMRGVLAGLDEDTRKQALSSIVGAENMEAWNAVIESSNGEFEKLSGKVQKVKGSAEEMADIMRKNAKGSLQEMKSALEDVAITIGDYILPYVKKFAEWISKLCEKFRSLSPETQQFIVIMGGIIAVIGPVLSAVGKVIGSFSLLKVLTGKTGGALVKLGLKFGGIGLAIVALVAVGAYLYTHWEDIKKWAKDLAKKIGECWDNIVNWTSEKWSQVCDFMSNTWKRICSTVEEWLIIAGAKVKEGWDKCVEVTTNIWNGICDVVSTVWDTICNLVQVGIMLIAEVIKAGVQIILLPWTFLWENCKDYIIPIWEKICSYVSEKLELVKTYVSEKLEAVKNFFVEKWTLVRDKTIEIYEEISNTISEKLEQAKTWVSEKLESIKQFFVDKWTTARDKTVEIYEKIASVVSEKLEQAKSYVSEKLEAIKNYFSDKFEQAKAKVVEKMNAIKQNIQDKINSAKSIASSAIDAIKSKFDIFGTIASNVTEKFNKIKSSISDKMNDAKDIVKKAVDKIKSFFDIKLEFPKIKVPVFGFSGKFSVNPPSVPSFGIKSWKWLNKGAIFKRKTVLPSGYGVGDASFGGVGNNAEAVLPINKLPELLGLDKKENNGGISLNIERFENNREQDIEQLANELAFYLKRKKLIGGA